MHPRSKKVLAESAAGAAAQRCRTFSSDTNEDPVAVTGASCYSWIVNKHPFPRLQANTAHTDKAKNKPR